MAEQDFKRIMIWSGWLRLSHACIGLSTIALLLTGWLISESPSLANDATDIHYLSASILLFGLVLRLVLMFAGKPQEKLAALVPEPADMRGIRSMAAFYLSLGRSALPRWFAHNPFWKLIYLVMFLGLTIQIISGTAISKTDFIAGFYLPSIHEFWAGILLWLSALHVVSVVLHDLKGKTSDISGIINGYRTLPVEPAELPKTEQNTVQYVSIDEIMKK